MRLTVYTDYALRVLIYLGLQGPELATVGEIARGYGISKNHLMKVVQELGRLGYVETVRGKGGGLRLAKAPHEIRVGDVVRHVESDFALVQCFGDGVPRCRIERACVLRSVFDEARHAFEAVLDKYTLADLIAPGGRLTRLLLADAPAA